MANLSPFPYVIASDQRERGNPKQGKCSIVSLYHPPSLYVIPAKPVLNLIGERESVLLLYLCMCGIHSTSVVSTGDESNL